MLIKKNINPAMAAVNCYFSHKIQFLVKKDGPMVGDVRLCFVLLLLVLVLIVIFPLPLMSRVVVVVLILFQKIKIHI